MALPNPGPLVWGTYLDIQGAGVVSGQMTIGTLPAFVAGDRYVVADATGNLHLSALGPAS